MEARRAQRQAKRLLRQPLHTGIGDRRHLRKAENGVLVSRPLCSDLRGAWIALAHPYTLKMAAIRGITIVGQNENPGQMQRKRDSAKRRIPPLRKPNATVSPFFCIDRARMAESRPRRMHPGDHDGLWRRSVVPDLCLSSQPRILEEETRVARLPV